MVKSGKPIYSKLNYIYTLSFEKYILFFVILYYIREFINRKILLARVLLALFSILFFVFI